MAHAKKAKTAREIVEKAMPNVKVVGERSKTAGKSARVSGRIRSSPSIDAVRRKYLKQGISSDAASNQGSAAAESVDDIEVVRVRSKQQPADPADDLGSRTVIVSKSRGIIGTQG